MNHQEFTINSRGEDFRLAEISPVKLLAITTQIDFDNFQQTETLFEFALSNIEVKQGNKWLPVKVSGREVYNPIEIKNDLPALNELITYFMNEVIAKVFQPSSE